MNQGQYPYNQNNHHQQNYHQPQQYQQQYQPQQHDDYSHAHRVPDELPQQQQQPLPPGWVEATDNTGRIYYCNPRTQETRWDRPENLLQVSNHLPQQYQQQLQHQQQQQQPQQYQQISPLPPGWVEATDNTTGKIYYCNPQTRETKWERPSMISTTPQEPEITGHYNHNYIDSNNYNNNNQGMMSLSTVTTTPATAMSVAMGVNNDIYTSNNHYQSCNNNNTSTNVIGSNREDNNNNSNNNNNINFDELRSMTTGQIALLCKLRKRQAREQKEEEEQQPNKEEATKTTTSTNKPYIPINLSSMSLLSVAERAEPGRLDVRMHSLREELNKFGYIPS